MDDLERWNALRVLDANANRAGEGLRTIEDVARLVREDSQATTWVKELRHRLAAACDGIDRAERLRARSTESDAGTELSTPSEILRHDCDSIVRAAVERVTQSLRCLEEFSKIFDSNVGEKFKQLRYEAYDVLAKTELRLTDPGRHSFPDRLILLIDCSLPLHEFITYVQSLSQAGVDCFQLRDKAADGQQLMQCAAAAVECLTDLPSRLLVNDRIDIALASGASGVHVGQEDVGLSDVRHLSRGRLCVGVSTHDLGQALAAQAGGADYIGCGPTFPSTTKHFDAFPGIDYLKQVAANITIPTFAIGGIDLENVQQVVDAGVPRIALSSAIHMAADPCAAAAAFRERLDA